MIITVRQLSLADVDWAAAVLAATGLRARQPELRRYLALEPGGYCAAEADGRPVGLGGFAAYADLAFVGNMAVVPEMQGRGVGRAILHRMLEDIDRCGIPTTLLEATPEGEPLYRKSGFVEEHRTLAYAGSGAFRPGEAPVPETGLAVRTLTEADLDAVAAFDRPRFGGSRLPALARFLQDFPGRGRLARRPSRRGRDARGELSAAADAPRRGRFRPAAGASPGAAPPGHAPGPRHGRRVRRRRSPLR